jgi:PAT family beta-lactamase induction signal transducer AmpG
VAPGRPSEPREGKTPDIWIRLDQLLDQRYRVGAGEVDRACCAAVPGPSGGRRSGVHGVLGRLAALGAPETWARRATSCRGLPVPKAAVIPPKSAESTPAAVDAAGAAGWASRAKAAPWVMSTYFAEGLPWSIVHQISQEFFTSMGSSLGAIGLTSLYGIPGNLKFLWSPLIDGYGTMRRWLFSLQAVIAVVVVAIAWPAQERDLGLVARLLLVLAVLGPTQDIAIDGFYLRVLGKADQAALSGLRVAAYRLAMLVGKGLLVMLAGWMSWRACFLIAGAIMAVLAVGHAAGLPREPPRSLEPDRTLGRIFVRAFTTFFAQPRAAVTILFILLYRAGDALMFAMATPLLARRLDIVDLATRGGINTVGTIAGIAGSIAGGAVIARIGLKRTLTPIALIQSLAILIYVALSAARPSLPWIMAAVVAEQLLAGVGTAALMVFLMSRCKGDYKASHFAVGSALMSVVTTFAGPLSGFVAERVGFTGLFLFAFAVSIPGVLLSWVVPKE